MSDDDETETDEDEDGLELTPELDAQILKTIAHIRSKSDVIYKDDTKFFGGLFRTF